MAGDLWAHTSLFTGVWVEHGFTFLLLALILFLSLSCCWFGSPPPQVFISIWWVCGRRSALPVLSVCVLKAPSCSTPLAGHRQPREHSTNCLGHQGYAASVSLSTLSALHLVTLYWCLTSQFTLPLQINRALWCLKPKMHHCREVYVGVYWDANHAGNTWRLPPFSSQPLLI